MHAVTQEVPLPVAPLRLLNRLTNAFFRIIAPKGGHIFFFFLAAIRKGTLPTSDCFATPFRCPKCQADLTFRASSCQACGLALPYGDAGYLDAMELNSTLKAILKSAQSLEDSAMLLSL